MSFDQREGGPQLPNLVQSVQRALRILEVIADNPDGITAKAIARRLELALSTTYHMLHTLVAEGYVVRLEGVAGVRPWLQERQPLAATCATSRRDGRSLPPSRRSTGMHAPPPTRPSTGTARW